MQQFVQIVSISLRTLLKTIKQSMQYKIILDCDVDKILEILKQAKEIGFLDYVHSYLLTSLVY